MADNANDGGDKATADNAAPATADNATVARSAGLAFLGRLGALVEIIALPAFAWLYGAANMGLFFTLWALVRVSTRFTEFAMPTTLQRFVPASDCPQRAQSIIKIAIAVPLALSTALALIITLLAPVLAETINAREEDAAHLVTIIRLYIWVLPFWTMLEVLTASVRAQRKFGPEIKVRVFYEQGLRLVAGVVFFALGYKTFGLFYAHLFSAIVTAFLSFRLACRFYDFKAVLLAPFDRALSREMLSFAAMMTPANFIKDVNSELPILLLNIMLPGVQGAHAAALYGVGRRLASALVVVRQSFEYVIAPFATASRAAEQHDKLNDMYAFSTRLICCLIVPMAALLLLIRHEILWFLPTEFYGAASVVLVLALGRMLEALTGPACTLVEMLGHRALPLINGSLGVITMITLQYFLAPTYGATGAAIAAAAGINVTSGLSLLEAHLIYRLQPYRRSLVRPFTIVLVCTLVMIFATDYAGRLSNTLEMSTVAICFTMTLVLLVRYGFGSQDVAALGRIGRWLKGNTRTG